MTGRTHSVCILDQLLGAQTAFWPGRRNVLLNTLAGGLLWLGMAAGSATKWWDWVYKEVFARYLGPGSGL